MPTLLLYDTLVCYNGKAANPGEFKGEGKGTMSQAQPSVAPWGEYVPGLASMSLDTFIQLPPEEGWIYELHQGRIIRMPGPGGAHGDIQIRLARLIGDYLDAQFPSWLRL